MSHGYRISAAGIGGGEITAPLIQVGSWHRLGKRKRRRHHAIRAAERLFKTPVNGRARVFTDCFPSLCGLARQVTRRGTPEWEQSDTFYEFITIDGNMRLHLSP